MIYRARLRAFLEYWTLKNQECVGHEVVRVLVPDDLGDTYRGEVLLNDACAVSNQVSGQPHVVDVGQIPDDKPTGSNHSSTLIGDKA